MTSRPRLVAQRRQVLGKHVARLRRDGQLPAVLFGHGVASEPLQIDAHEFDLFRRHAGHNVLLDLAVDGGRARPVMVHGVQEDPIARRPLHVDFLLVRMNEEISVDVPLVATGQAPAVDKLGGTLLHDLAHVRVRALPADLPGEVVVDVSHLDTFESVIHVSDLPLPPRVTLLTDAHEPVAHVAPPRVEEEVPTVAEEEALETAEGAAEGAAPEAAAEAGVGGGGEA